MMNQSLQRRFFLCIVLNLFVLLFAFTGTGNAQQLVTKRAAALNMSKVSAIEPFTVSGGMKDDALNKQMSKYIFVAGNTEIQNIIKTKPEYLKIKLPIDLGTGSFTLVLYKSELSASGFTLLSDKGRESVNNNIVHYRGAIEGDERSVVAFSFSETQTMGLICTPHGNYVLGKTGKEQGNNFILYNDHDLFAKNNYTCDKEMIASNNVQHNLPVPAQLRNGVTAASNNGNNSSTSTSTNTTTNTNTSTTMTTKCVNWYWETDYNVFVNKGSVANVNAYMQAVFNQVQTLYANDGIGVNLKTLFVWTTTSPYTGTTTTNYLNQFAAYRTSWDGDLAHLIGFAGNGGLAYVGGIQSCDYGMGQNAAQTGFSGVYSYYNDVPVYSWTIECITHEMGHQLGSNHTHDCVWNGNNTKIDDCGGTYGYSTGTCLPAPVQAVPTEGGTIMSYCHLSPAGTNLTLGFGPQPKALIVNNINNSSCLLPCGACVPPAQPGTMTGTATVCAGSAQTYSVPAVMGATSYTWTLPTGWTGTSSSNSIIVTAGTAGGNISVTATNSCGLSSSRILAVTVAALPAAPGTITVTGGAAAVCTGETRTYTVPQVAGLTYNWVAPVGGTITAGQGTNSVTISYGAGYTGSGSLKVSAVNGCGAGAANTLAIAGNIPAAPGTITVTGALKVCSGDIRTYSVPAMTGVTFNWVAPAGMNIISGQGTNAVVVSFTNAFVNASSIAVNTVSGCGSSAAKTLSISLNSSTQPSTITVTGTAKVCPGDTRVYTVTAITGTTFIWTAPVGGTITAGQGTNSVTVAYGAGFIAAGTLSVNASNACGISIPRTLAVTQNLPSTPGNISGQANVCSGTAYAYSVAAVSNATSYVWTATNEIVLSGNTTSNAVTVTPFLTGSISVMAVNGCGKSAPKTQAINITCTGAAPAAAPGTAMATTTPSTATKVIEPSIYPNPVTNGNINLTFYAEKNGAYMIDIYDFSGRVVRSENYFASTGINKHLITLPAMPRGSYFIKLANNSGKKILKFEMQ